MLYFDPICGHYRVRVWNVNHSQGYMMGVTNINFFREGAHVIDTSKRVFIEDEPMNLTLCGLLLSNGEMYSTPVFFVASVATVVTGSYCDDCKAAVTSESAVRTDERVGKVARLATV